MKTRIWLSAVLLALSVVLLAGCSQEDAETAGETEEAEETQEESGAYSEDAYVANLDIMEYVTLGEYLGIEVSVDEAAVSEEYLESYLSYVMQVFTETEEITDRAVEEGDTVNIDFEGKVDGETIDGGSSEDYDLVIGSGTFIDGFEEGLIGVEIGETVDLELVFPTTGNYEGTELAGADVVFTVTVNSIQVETVPELTDEFVAQLGIEDCETVEDFRQYAYDILMEDAEETHDEEAQSLILEAVLEDCEFEELPDALVERYYDSMVTNIEYYASSYGFDTETFMTLMGTTDEDLQESGLIAAQQVVAMQAIAQLEGITITDEEYDEFSEENASYYGYDSVEEYLEDVDEAGAREYLLAEKVLEYLFENAVITDVPAED